VTVAGGGRGVVAGGCRWLLRGYEWIRVVAYNCGVAAVLKVITGSSKWQVAAGSCRVAAGLRGCRWLQRGCRAAGCCRWLLRGYEWTQVVAYSCGVAAVLNVITSGSRAAGE